MHSLTGAAVAVLLAACVRAQTWPNQQMDELEDIMFLTSGYRSRNFAVPVSPCVDNAGRVTAAEWIRTVFHDVTDGNVFFKQGGLDASIVYELNFDDNTGVGFKSALTAFEPFYGPAASMSDIIALSTYTAVRACGGPIVPILTNRIDAIKAGSVGNIPAPQSTNGTFANQFQRWGYDNAGMVAMVACGHTLGNVHAVNQPLILDPSSVPPYATMDSTSAVFDNKIATEFVGNTTANPLVNGPVAIKNKRTSDLTVYSIDQGQHIAKLTDPTYFASQCQTVFAAMTTVVPRAVTLSTQPITVYDCKPYDVSLYLLDDGKSLTFSGDLRIRTTNRPATSIASVGVVYLDRTGASCAGCTISTTSTGTSGGLDDSFSFYGFSAKISATTSISSFNVVITHTDGSTETLNNGGSGFPVQDVLLLQQPKTCLSGSALTITAAVRTGQNAVPRMNAITKQYTPSTYRPLLNTTSASLTLSNTTSSGPYTFYSTTVYLNTAQIGPGTRYNLTLPGTTNTISYQDLTKISSVCSTTPIKQTPSYTAQGCVSDSVDQRTLSLTRTYSSNMTTEFCAAYCKDYTYFGTEYSQECYCGNTLPQGLQNSTACTMTCAGDSTETCGGSNALNLFSNPSTNTPPPSNSILGYTYQGCVSDNVNQRTLAADRKDDSTGMTLESCAAYCAAGKYSYFGTEYSAECYCGSVLPTASNSTACSMSCSGNSSETCGGPGALSLYQNPSFGTLQAPARIGNFVFQGCYTDDVNQRSLGADRHYDTTGMTLDECGTYCAAGGYAYFGTEYSAECYCGNTLGGSKAATADCSMTCSGNKGQPCGNANRLTVYGLPGNGTTTTKRDGRRRRHLHAHLHGHSN